MVIPEGKQLILFDGVCNLCNSTVQFIIKHDKKELFVFTTLQSEIGQRLAQERGIDTTKMDSLILIVPNTAYYIQSGAALQIAYQLGGFYKILKIFGILPQFARDAVYNFIAKNRYKWYGKRAQCMLPTPELKQRFLQ